MSDLEQVLAAMNARFDAVDARFDRVDVRLDGLERRIDTMERSLRQEIRAVAEAVHNLERRVLSPSERYRPRSGSTPPPNAMPLAAKGDE